MQWRPSVPLLTSTNPEPICSGKRTNRTFRLFGSRLLFHLALLKKTCLILALDSTVTVHLVLAIDGTYIKFDWNGKFVREVQGVIQILKTLQFCLVYACLNTLSKMQEVKKSSNFRFYIAQRICWIHRAKSITKRIKANFRLRKHYVNNHLTSINLNPITRY